MKINPVILVVFFSLFFHNCEKGDNETKISKHFTNESHNAGKDCMNCHKRGGSGEGWFTLAGSLYNGSLSAGYPNATVFLSTELAKVGSLVQLIEIDNVGNFYTTEAINYGNGLYVSIQGTQNDSAYMHAKIVSGNCNACHGNSTEKIRLP